MLGKSKHDNFTCSQIEWLTGGECLAGMHEVVVNNRTLDAIERARQQNRSLWRVSSTVSSSAATFYPQFTNLT